MRKVDYAEINRDQLVQQHLPLVKKIAYRIMAKLPPSVQVDDLIQVGLMGLLEAAANYNSAQNAEFEAYATQRIRGAMLDELRQQDWQPRSARRMMREIEAVMHQLEQRLKRPPTEQEMAQAMNLSVPEYQERLNDASGHQLLYYEDFRGPEEGHFLEQYHHDRDAGEPLACLEAEGFREVLVAAIADLPPREQLLMSLYYDEELNLREIGEVMEVTESRVCQLHAQAIARLRGRLKDYIK